jgi:hypothetical protein
MRAASVVATRPPKIQSVVFLTHDEVATVSCVNGACGTSVRIGKRYSSGQMATTSNVGGIKSELMNEVMSEKLRDSSNP